MAVPFVINSVWGTDKIQIWVDFRAASVYAISPNTTDMLLQVWLRREVRKKLGFTN